jgi:hypothetical protein
METVVYQAAKFHLRFYQVDLFQGGRFIESVNPISEQGIKDTVRNASRWYSDLRAISYKIAWDGRAERIVVEGIPDGGTIS